MRVRDAFITFMLKMNESATSRGVAVNKGKFCVIFNKNLLEVVKEYLDHKDSDEIDMIKELHVNSEQLLNQSSSQDHDVFSLPKNFLEYSKFKVTAISNRGCSDLIKIFPIKAREAGEVLFDEHNKPSFYFREAPFILVSEGVKIFKDKFDIEDVSMSYYKAPRQVQLINSSDPDSQFIDYEFELRDLIINKAIDKTVVEYSLSHEDYNKFQAELANNNQKQNNK